MSRHGGHALPSVVVVHGEGLVSAGGGGEGAGAVQRDLDQRPVVARRTLFWKKDIRVHFYESFWFQKYLECSRVLSVGDSVDPDVSVLAGGQDVLGSGVHLHVVKRGLANLNWNKLRNIYFSNYFLLKGKNGLFDNYVQ